MPDFQTFASGFPTRPLRPLPRWSSGHPHPKARSPAHNPLCATKIRHGQTPSSTPAREARPTARAFQPAGGGSPLFAASPRLWSARWSSLIWLGALSALSRAKPTGSRPRGTTSRAGGWTKSSISTPFSGPSLLGLLPAKVRPARVCPCDEVRPQAAVPARWTQIHHAAAPPRRRWARGTLQARRRSPAVPSPHAPPPR